MEILITLGGLFAFLLLGTFVARFGRNSRHR